MTDNAKTQTSPKLQTPGTLITQIQPYVNNANELKLQAQRAEIVSQEDYDKAVDFIKICSFQMSKQEEVRTSLVGPLNTHVKWINAQFKPVREQFEAAKALMTNKANVWRRAEEKRLKEIEDRKQREAEERALAEAESAAASGDTEMAEAILNVAAETPIETAKVPAGRGSYTGAAGSTRREWKGKVVDLKALCAAIGRGDLPESLIREVSKSELNRLAKKEAKASRVHGIEIYEDDSLVVK